MRSLALLALLIGCAEPFDPNAWRIEELVICVADPTVPLQCQTMRCEVRGDRGYLYPGQVFRVLDNFEYRNCVPV